MPMPPNVPFGIGVGIVPSTILPRNYFLDETCDDNERKYGDDDGDDEDLGLR